MSENKLKTILAIGAHPDDIEFGCGATMAKLNAEGHQLIFVVATDGNRGSRQHEVEKSALIQSRKKEQQDAANILGAKEIVFLDQEDGNLKADLSFKELVVRQIRKYKPDMIFTHDPSWYYSIREDGTASVNHTDHRACGEAVLDGVYPLARDLQSFPNHAIEGLMPHITPELYLFTHGKTPTFGFELTEQEVDTQIKSIWAHTSQIDHPQQIADMIKSRRADHGRLLGYPLAEGFTRLIFK